MVRNSKKNQEKEKPAVSVRSESASVPMAVTQPSEVAAVRKEKEQLEQQLAAVKARALESEDKAAQLSSHVMVLEDLLEQKKGQLDFIEGKLEAMGMDPIAVRPFDKDASLDRQAYLKQQAAEFDDRLLFLRQGVERRNELLSESLRALQHISEALEVLETQ